MKQIKEYWKIYFSEPKARISFGLSLIALIGLLYFGAKKEDSGPVSSGPLVTSDELIPEGFVLVPLDLQNREALDALIGDFAVVDLFKAPPGGQGKGLKVGRRLKLVRSAQNHEQFAALVPEDQTGTLLSNAGPLFAVIQSRQAQKGSGMIRKSLVHSRIHFSNGGSL